MRLWPIAAQERRASRVQGFHQAPSQFLAWRREKPVSQGKNRHLQDDRKESPHDQAAAEKAKEVE